MATPLALLLLLLLCPSSSDAAVRTGGAAADELALLSFKSSLLPSEGGDWLLASWNTSRLHYCAWPGVACGHQHPDRVVELRLRSSNLSGTISPSLGNLSFLIKLDLGGNYLSGEIPPELGRLSRLRWLKLSSNSLQGSIPAAFGACTRLTGMDLSNNKLRGTIPFQIGAAMKNLLYLYLDGNGLSGKIPESLAELPSIQELYLNNNTLSGDIPSSLGNLTGLSYLDVSNNMLTGPIPSSLGKIQELSLNNNTLSGDIPSSLGNLTGLSYLSLSYNTLTGPIPSSLGNLTGLSDLSLSYNTLTGPIPSSLGNLTGLSYLDVSNNMLTGPIPSSLGKLASLSDLVLSDNTLSGTIPSSLGQLSRLSVLSIGFNNLSGMIPDGIWNLTSLTHISVQYNMLSGIIPANAFSTLSHLKRVHMDKNLLHGYIPASISNASNISMLTFDMNSFSGVVPPGIGRLKNLETLVLAETSLEAEEPNDWKFMTALTNCSKLRVVEMAACKFGGLLPDSVSNLSSSLVYLSIRDNTISGSLPKDIGNLVNLESLILFNNSFTGPLPSSFGKLQNLHRLILFNNKISGFLPSTIGNLTQLNNLELHINAFSGTIPSTLGNLTTLFDLNLAHNNFTGHIPIEIFGIPTLSANLDVSHNNLEGSIPQEIGKLKNIVEFHADSNKLSGEIPSTLGECQILQHLFLQNNFLNGNIPISLAMLKGLDTLDLSSNNLSGQIPTSLGDMTTLHSLNLSFNSFAGEVPTNGAFANASEFHIEGNANLCGGISELRLPPCSLRPPKRKHRILLVLVPIAISLVSTLAILSLLFVLQTWHKRRQTEGRRTNQMQGHPMITYVELVKATDGFSPTNLLGSGSFGSVYKGKFDSNNVDTPNLVAVKVLKLENPMGLKSLIAECEALRNLRHRNLVKIVTICSSMDNRGNDFKALVYDFMPNGSLDDWLHTDTNNISGKRHLNLHQRVTILLDVACVLDYLHCHVPAPVVHCDVKSSNVLLDADMVAHVGDFGLAKILVEGSSTVQQSTSSMGFRGTTGYAAPEYGVGNMVSTHGDIYSYGILVLETVTGNRPTDNRFRQGLSLREYVELALPDKVMDIVDRQLTLDLRNEHETLDDSSDKRMIDCLVSVLRLGISCSHELPLSRIRTTDIVKKLHAIRESLSREHRI